MKREWQILVGYHRQRIFEELFLKWKSKEEINFLYDAGYSPISISAFFLNHYSELDWLQENFIYKNEKVHLFSEIPSVKTCASRLKKIVPYSKEQYRIHLNSSEWIKSGHKYPNISEEEFNTLMKSKQEISAFNTHEKRRKKEYYNPKNHFSYYEGTDEEKNLKAFEHRRSKSPMTIEFWIKKGLDISEAKLWISENAKKGAIKSCESQKRNIVSKLEQDVYDELSKKYEIVQQLRIEDRFFDIACEKSKKILEIDGTYWHCDSRIYDPEYLHISGKKAKDIWESDLEKQALAEKNGYSVLRIKELDLCKDYKKTIKLIETYFLGE